MKIRCKVTSPWGQKDSVFVCPLIKNSDKGILSYYADSAGLISVEAFPDLFELIESEKVAVIAAPAWIKKPGEDIDLASTFYRSEDEAREDLGGWFYAWPAKIINGVYQIEVEETE